jgi:cytochrome P450
MQAVAENPSPLPIKPRVNLLDPEHQSDPHAFWAKIRESGRLSRDKLGIYLICQHADVTLGVRSRKLSRSPSKFHLYPQLRPFGADSVLERAVESWITFSDQPQHARLRGLFNIMFKPVTIMLMRERIQAITDRLLDQLPPGDTFDLVPALAQPLPLLVMGDLLGLEDWEVLSSKVWSDVLATVFEPIKSRTQQNLVNDSLTKMLDMLKFVLARYRQGKSVGPDSLLGVLVQGMDDGKLTEHELLSNMVITFGGGTETTTCMIGNGLYLLLQHPTAWQMLQARPELIPQAMEEVLRYEGPVTFTDRYTAEPTEIAGEMLPAGQALYFMLNAANRDPRVFDRPDEFDITRQRNPHVAFGGGPHYCVGAPMARLEFDVALTRLLERFPKLALVHPQANWRSGFNMRALASLPLRHR